MDLAEMLTKVFMTMFVARYKTNADYTYLLTYLHVSIVSICILSVTTQSIFSPAQYFSIFLHAVP